MTSQEPSTVSGHEKETDPHRISDAGYMTVASLLSVVWVLGTVFNITSLCVFLLTKKLRSPTNMFVMSLNLCDLCMSFVGTFMAMTSAWKKEWLYGHHGCIFEGFAVYFLGLTSVYLLCAISIDRYIVIAKPLLGPRITTKVAVGSIGLCWMGGFLWAALPLMGWNEYVLEGAGVSCSVVWESSNPNYTSYIFTIFFFCLLLPLAVMAFCYFNVYMTIRSMSRNTSWRKTSRVAIRNIKVEKKMAKTIAFLLAAFLGCWMPYAIFSFIVVFQGSEAVWPELATYPAVLAKTQGLVNPVLFVATNKQFRQAFYDLLPCLRLREKLKKRKERSSYSGDSSSNEEYDSTTEDTNQASKSRSNASKSTAAGAKKSHSVVKKMGNIKVAKNAVSPLQEVTSPKTETVFSVSEQIDSVASPPNRDYGPINSPAGQGEKLEVIELIDSSSSGPSTKNEDKVDAVASC